MGPQAVPPTNPAMTSAAQPSVVAPGNYDGVHLGHQALLSAARELAAPTERVVVLTFSPHPAQVLAPLRAPPLLTTIERRTSLLHRMGADHVEVVAFDRAFAGLTAGAFIEEVLVARLGATGVVVGPDFRFAKGREGDIDTLREAGLQVRAHGPIRREGGVVSSTRIRGLLREGDVDATRRLLGRVHDVGGQVVEGHRRGRTIGFPTANLDCEPVLLPADGVYAVIARHPDGSLLEGVANLGVRPTVEAGRSVEAHFFDFEGDLYGSTMRLGFVSRIRGEQKFGGLDELKAQIARDAQQARRDLAAADREHWAWV